MLLQLYNNTILEWWKVLTSSITGQALIMVVAVLARCHKPMALIRLVAGGGGSP
jgi:hypothetical protein